MKTREEIQQRIDDLTRNNATYVSLIEYNKKEIDLLAWVLSASEDAAIANKVEVASVVTSRTRDVMKRLANVPDGLSWKELGVHPGVIGRLARDGKVVKTGNGKWTLSPRSIEGSV